MEESILLRVQYCILFAKKLIVQVFFAKFVQLNRSDIESIWHIKTAAGWVVVQENDVSLIKHDVVFLTNFGFFKEKRKN